MVLALLCMRGIEKRLGVDYQAKFVRVDMLHLDAFSHQRKAAVPGLSILISDLSFRPESELN